MPGTITDLIDRVSDSSTGRPVIATLAAPGKAIGAASINLDAATNWTTSSAIHFSIYETTTVGSVTVKNASTQTDWKGTLSGVAIGNLTLTGGTDRAYTAGAKVEITPTARYAKDLYDWAMVGHNQNGTHKAFTESNIVPTAAIQDTAVTTAKLADGAVTAAKVSGIWWEELGRTTLASAGDTLSVATIANRKYLKVIFTISSTGGTVDSRIRFNNDATTSYSTRISVNHGATTGTISEVSSAAGTAIATSSFITGEFQINNISAQPKIGFGQVVAGVTASSSAPDVINVNLKWSNVAAPITRIDLINTGTGDYGIGSEIVILGHN